MGAMVSSPIETSMGSNNQFGIAQNHRHRDDVIDSTANQTTDKNNSLNNQFNAYELNTEYQMEKKMTYIIFGGIIILLTLILILTSIGWTLASKKARRYAKALAYHQGRFVNSAPANGRGQRDEEQMLMAGKPVYLDTSVPNVPNNAPYVPNSGIMVGTVC